MLKLQQVLSARIDKHTFIAYKYKRGYLIRKERYGIVWNEYESFAEVIESLKWFEYDCNHPEDDFDGDEPIPF